MLHPDWYTVDKSLPLDGQCEVSTLMETLLWYSQRTGHYPHAWLACAIVHRPVMVRVRGNGSEYACLLTGN